MSFLVTLAIFACVLLGGMIVIVALAVPERSGPRRLSGISRFRRSFASVSEKSRFALGVTAVTAFLVAALGILFLSLTKKPDEIGYASVHALQRSGEWTQPAPPHPSLSSPHPPSEIDSRENSTKGRVADVTSERTAPLPAWAKRDEDVAEHADREGDDLVLHSRQYATVEEAERDLMIQAVAHVRERFEKTYRPVPGWEIPQDYIRENLYGRRHVERITRSAGEHSFVVHRVHRELHLSSAITDTQGTLYASWRKAVVSRRLWTVGGGVGAATFVLLLSSIGFRWKRSTSPAA